jgi:hypothetical protein
MRSRTGTSQHGAFPARQLAGTARSVKSARARKSAIALSRQKARMQKSTHSEAEGKAAKRFGYMADRVGSERGYAEISCLKQVSPVAQPEAYAPTQS